MLTSNDNSLTWTYDNHTLQITPQGPHALRIRATANPLPFSTSDWALTELVTSPAPDISCPDLSSQSPLPISGTYTVEPLPLCKPATLNHGNLKATISPLGHLSIHDASDKPVLIEKNRTRIDPLAPSASALEIPARDFKSLTNSSSHWHTTFRLESLDPNEKIYGGGQYQQPNLNLKGSELELAQRNSQASIPFFVSSLGYGILWNCPSIGRANFGRNGTTFEARAAEGIDIWLVAPPQSQASNGPSTKNNLTEQNISTQNIYKHILHLYADATGHAPPFPPSALGFWQCKLRYRTQSELLSVAREFHRRSLPLSVIVVDFFHWPTQGDWKFDSKFFPDSRAMISELGSMGIKLLVSIWPTVDARSENYAAMLERGHLIRVNRGVRVAMDFMGNTCHADFTSPKAREYVWDVVKRNYFDLGVRLFWLDEAEPEYSKYDFENYRYHLGTDLSIGNIYPVGYAQAFYDGQISAGQPKGEIVNLIRCAWAGSQKYGTLLWSGDIASSWESFRCQVVAGQNVGVAGIPWWTTDIGGFHGGVTTDPSFRELLVRWFQWGCFCPVMRLHGSREPILPKLGEGGGSDCRSGADNEPWSFGQENYPILVRYMKFREYLRGNGYLQGLMSEASESGTPLMRGMWLEFPEDERCRTSEVETQYMFGSRYLVVPVLEAKAKVKKVYLPRGSKWTAISIGEDNERLGKTYEGGELVEVQLTMEDMPVFVRGG